METTLSVTARRSGAIFVLLTIFLPSVSFAQSASDCVLFSRSLKRGMEGQDVRVLQQLLNKKQNTSVVNTGPGSFGLETTYFGSKTHLAVIKFQEFYKNEVLTPAGLTVGTGFVGPLTRAKLLALCLGGSGGENGETKPVVTPPASGDPSLVTPAPVEMVKNRFGKPYLIAPSTYVGTLGSSIKVAGSGLPTSENIVHIDNFVIPRSTVDARGAISFVLPNDAPKGIHSLWIETSVGTSNKLLFIVTDGKSTPPIATSVTPSTGAPGTPVTVFGSGFTPTGNRVQGGFGVIKDIPSPDGKTLQFVLTPSVPGMTATRNGDILFPFHFYVVNENGMSKPLPFTLKL